MRVVLIGGTVSSAAILRALVRHDLEVVGVIGIDAADPAKVSGYADIARTARELGIANVVSLRSAKGPDALEFVRSAEPDVLFAVGLSQLIPGELLAVARLGSVGFHPTRLPQGRGRAPIAWLTELGVGGAATFFEMTEGADEGGVLVQEPFPVYDTDHAGDVYERALEAVERGLDRWLPELAAGTWNPVPQSTAGVTIWGRRTQQDGVIHWDRTASEVDALVRAAAAPHPGAFTYIGDAVALVTRSHGAAPVVSNALPGTVLSVDDEGRYLVQAGDRALLLEIDADVPVRVGSRLGYDVQNELHELRRRVSALEARLNDRDDSVAPARE